MGNSTVTLPSAGVHSPSGNSDVAPVPSVDDDREVWYVAITDFPKGLGSTTRSRSICTALRIAGRRPRLLIPYAIGHGTNEQVTGVEDGLPYEYINGSVTRPRGARRVVQAKLRGAGRVALRLLKARRRVSSVFLYNMSAFDAWPVLLAARMRGIPVVLDLTDEWHDPSIPIRSLGWPRYFYQLISRTCEGVVFRSASRIIVVTRHFERRLHRHASKVVRLPMLFDPVRFERGPVERSTGESVYSIVYAGSISSTEGIPGLIEAMARLRSGPASGARLRLIGSPAHGESIATYQELAARAGVEDRLTFLPSLDRDAYAACLRGADLLVIPRTTAVASRAGFPYKLGEYLASGTPVVVTRFGDVEEYFVDHRDCFMCAPDDPGSLASALEYAVGHREEARAIGRVGQVRARELFSFENVAGVLGAMLREIEGAAGAGRVRRVAEPNDSRG